VAGIADYPLGRERFQVWTEDPRLDGVRNLVPDLPPLPGLQICQIRLDHEMVQAHKRVRDGDHWPAVQQEILPAVYEPSALQHSELVGKRAGRTPQQPTDLRRRALPRGDGGHQRRIDGGVAESWILVYHAVGLAEQWHRRA